MNLEEIFLSIKNFKVTEEMEDYEVSEFFDEIRGKITDTNLLTDLQKKELIINLFDFLKTQDPEMDENFSFIHFIENIDNPTYEIYNAELLKFNTENGTITSILLLNHINSLKGNESEKCVELIKNISENKNHTEYVREFALDFYEHQIQK